MSPDSSSLLKRNSSLFGFLVVRSAASFSDQMVAIVVGWQVYAMTKSTFYLGMVGLVEFAPMILLTLLVGYAADRYNRKVIFCLSQTLAAIAYFVLAAGNLFGWINTNILFVIIFIIGIKNAFQGATVQSMLPNIVTKEDFPKATALSGGVGQVAVIAGPALGGLLYALGSDVVYVVAGVCTVLAIVSTLFIRMRNTRDASAREPVTMKTLLAGISFIKSQPVILGAISFDLFAVLFGGATALLPVYASEILKVGRWGLACCAPPRAVGALLMSVFFTRRPIKRHVGRNMFTAVAIFGIGTIIFALSRSFALSLASLALLGGADVISVVIRSTLVQMATPDSMRGRVSSVGMVFISTSNQLGEFESGVTASFLGPVLATVVGGIGTIGVVVLWSRLFPQLAHADRFAHDEPGGDAINR